MERFAREARLAARLAHPGVGTVHELHEAGDGAPFSVMRLVEGRPLTERLHAFHHFSLDRSRRAHRLIRVRLLQTWITVCETVAYAHARGVLHRDLKPGNVVVGDHGETVLLDWGLGERVAADPADAAWVVGTPQYMPPEQAEGKADERSDVFGLGAILYEILTGQPPYPWEPAALPPDWRVAVRDAAFPSPRRVSPSAPRPLAAIAMKAMAPKPADRYGGAAELADEGRRSLANEPIRGSGLSGRLLRRLSTRAQAALGQRAHPEEVHP